MLPDRDRVSLQDMITSARQALSYVSGKTPEEFYDDALMQDAVSWRIAVIGECARRISSETQQRIPDLRWRQMINMRHRLIHEYDNVRLDIVWETTQLDLPPLART